MLAFNTYVTAPQYVAMASELQALHEELHAQEPASRAEQIHASVRWDVAAVFTSYNSPLTLIPCLTLASRAAVFTPYNSPLTLILCLTLASRVAVFSSHPSAGHNVQVSWEAALAEMLGESPDGPEGCDAGNAVGSVAQDGAAPHTEGQAYLAYVADQLASSFTQTQNLGHLFTGICGNALLSVLSTASVTAETVKDSEDAQSREPNGPPVVF